MTYFEWTLHYDENGRRLLIVLGKTTGQGVIAAGSLFTCGKVLQFNYEDEDSPTILLHVDTSKRERVMKLSEDRLVLGFCESVETVYCWGSHI